MKKIYLLLVAALLGFVSCTDAELMETVRNHEGRINDLESFCMQMKENVNSLQLLVKALEEKDFVTEVTPIKRYGKTIGYTINFTKSNPVTIYHGEKGDKGDAGHSPKIGVKKDTDGIYYWTLDENWLLNQDGQKVKAEGLDGQSGSTPELKIMEGYWYIRYGNEEWRKSGPATGQDGDSFFKDVTVGTEDVTITLANGEVFTLPLKKAEKISIIFDHNDIGVLPGKTTSINYEITGAGASPIIKALGQNGWSARVDATTATRGTITVKAPDPLTEDEIIVLVSDGDERTIIRTLNFVSGVITPSTEALGFGPEASSYLITVDTNLNYEIYIPEADREWLSTQPFTKAMRTDHLIFSARENIGKMRQSRVEFRDAEGLAMRTIKIIQEGKVASKPTQDQIFFSTHGNVGVTFNENFNSCMGANVISSTYLGNIGIVTFDRPITKIGHGAFQNVDFFKSIEIPEGVTLIEDWAFRNCTGLENVKLPASLTKMDVYIFTGCTSLKQATLPDGLTEVAQGTFDDCYNLTSVTLPAKVINFAYGAFKNTGFETFTIPATVQRIGKYAFEDCRNIKSIYVESTTVPSGDERMFANHLPDRKIYVPMESVEAYKAAPYWSEYAADIVGYDFNAAK